jgi:hypothetical protein
VWWWINADWWNATRTASASIPSLTVTAQARLIAVTWYAGDGTSRICTGPGTPWTPGTNPAAASPTCGHTYTTTSHNSPDGTYTLRAEVTWTINWWGDDNTRGPGGIVSAVLSQIGPDRCLHAESSRRGGRHDRQHPGPHG